ncbi:MAG TPA: glycosyltransferase family 39 protein, partial [Candidatus Saccharimonadales bacterium]|nr:glycosyltransferase family 39 protein [Candidatus Saccharimonadales bacterium]
MKRAAGGRPGLWLFATLACAYMVTFGGHLYSGDGIEMWRTAASLVRHGDLALEQDTPGRTWGYAGADGRRYAPYALGLSVVEAPFYAAGRAAGAALGLEGTSREKIDWAAGVLANVPVTALTGLLVFLVGLAAGYSRRASASAGLLYGLGTMAWVYSKHDFAEPLCALALLGCVWFLLRFRERGALADLVAAGALNGFSFFTKYQMVIYTPILLAFILLATPAKGRRGAPLVRILGAFLLPGLLFGLANLYVNHLRFGTWLHTGYGNQGEIFAGWTHVPIGLFGLLLSPGKGLFWYSPLLLAAPFAWRAFHRRSPALSLLGGAIAAATVLMFAPLWWWHGDWSWGPRYLVIPLPFLVLPFLAWLDPSPGGRPARIRSPKVRAVIAGLLVAAVFVNFLGAGVSFFFPLQALTDAGNVHDDWNFLPGLSPLRFHAHVVMGWIRRAAGHPAHDFVYRKWRDGALTDERIPVDAFDKGSDFFFFRSRGSGAESAALVLAGLLFGAGALLSAARL